MQAGNQGFLDLSDVHTVEEPSTSKENKVTNNDLLGQEEHAPPPPDQPDEEDTNSDHNFDEEEDKLNICTINPNSNKACYCFLSNPQLNCKTFKEEPKPTIQKKRASMKTIRRPTPEVEDTRSTLETFRDLVNKICKNVSPEYKEVMDRALCRDTSQKEIVEGNYLTQKDLRRMVSIWKKQDQIKREEKESLKEIENTLNKSIKIERDEDVFYNFEALSGASLPVLDIKVQKATEGGEPIRIKMVADSGASHLSLPTSMLPKLKLTEDQLLL